MTEKWLLDNELVRKYFGKCEVVGTCLDAPGCSIASRVLKAMQEPIRREDLYLCITEHNGEISYEEAKGNISLFNRWHPTCLRLPSQFQPKPEKEPLMCNIWCHVVEVGKGCPCGFYKPQPARGCTCHPMLIPCPIHRQPQSEKCNCSRTFHQGHGICCPVSYSPKTKRSEEFSIDIQYQMERLVIHSGESQISFNELCDLLRKDRAERERS